MNKVYFVRCYSFRNNEYARFILTAKSQGQAEQECVEFLGGDWKARGGRFICDTDNIVFEEV